MTEPTNLGNVTILLLDFKYVACYKSSVMHSEHGCIMCKMYYT